MNNTKNSYSDLEHLELVARRIAESGVDITSNYGDWMDVTFSCASLGEAAREPYHTICSQYPGYSREECDAKFDNCLRTSHGGITLGTLMKLAKDNSIDTSLPKGRRPKSEEKRKEERENRFRLMSEKVREWYDFRFNTWKNRVEIRELNTYEWTPLNDRDLSTLFTRLQECGICVKQADLKALLESRDFSSDYNAVNDWLEGLTPYNPEEGRNYLHEFFAEHLTYGDPENADFYQRMLEKWFVGMVALWIGRADENPIMPVFCGPQHIGKTFFIRHLLPPELCQYYKEPSPRDPVDKDFIISLSEVVMIFLDEFSISSSLKSDTYKAIITSKQSNLRDAYAHFREVRQRKASLIGATNLMQFIRDVEGNRRYVGIDLVATTNLKEHPLPYEGAYAQALWLLENGYDPKPTKEESEEISKHNITFMEPNDTEEALMSFLRHPNGLDTEEMLSAGDLMQELGVRGFRGPSFNSNNIGKAMRHLGFEKKMRQGYTKYRVVIKDFELLKKERKIEAVRNSENEGETSEKLLPL